MGPDDDDGPVAVLLRLHLHDRVVAVVSAGDHPAREAGSHASGGPVEFDLLGPDQHGDRPARRLTGR